MTKKYVDQKCLLCSIKYVLMKKCCQNIHTYIYTQTHTYIYMYMEVNNRNKSDSIKKTEKEINQKWWIYYDRKSTLECFGFNKPSSGL